MQGGDRPLLSEPVRISTPYLRESDINGVFEALDNINSDERFLLEIKWTSNELVDVDPGFFGYLSLLRWKFPHGSFRLRIEGNPARPSSEGSLFDNSVTATEALANKIASYIAYVKALDREGFQQNHLGQLSLHIPKGTLKDEVTRRFDYFSRNLKLHNKVIPPIPINDSADGLFEDMFIRASNRFFKSTIKGSQVFKPLFSKALVAIREELGWSDVQDWNARKFSNLISGFSRDVKEEYIDFVLDNILRPLDSLPPIYTLLFHSVLLNSDNPKKVIVADGEDKPQAERKALEKKKALLKTYFDFSSDLSTGVIELGKNIIEHSSTRKGVFVLRVLGEHYMSATNVSTQEESKIRLFNEWYAGKHDGQGATTLFLVSVFDLGDKSVTETVKSSAENERDLINKHLSKLRSDSEKSVLQPLIDALRDEGEFIQNENILLRDIFDVRKLPLVRMQARAIAHFGLMATSSLVVENFGQIIAGSKSKHKEIGEICTWDIEETRHEIPALGTYINILLPTPSIKKAALPVNVSSSTITSKDVQSFSDLFRYSKRLHSLEITDSRKSGRELEVDVIVALVKKVEEATSQPDFDDGAARTIIHIDFSRLMDITESSLYRIFAVTLTYLKDIDFIVSGISDRNFQKLLKFNTIIFENLKGDGVEFWSSNKSLLVYSDIPNGDSGREVRPNLLWGSNPHEFLAADWFLCAAGARVPRYIRSDLEVSKEDVAALVADNHKLFNSHAALINGATLLPFEVLLRSQGETLFLHNANAVLNREVLSEGHDKPQGYKMSDSHFRIGSRLHVSDFYYAKRFFQNNYYCANAALTIAYQVIARCEGETEPVKHITIVGYEVYSEMLVSLTAIYLRDYFSSNDTPIEVSTNIFSNSIKGNMSRRNRDIGDYVVVVTPIASTFSSSVKVMEQLQSLGRDSNRTFCISFILTFNKEIKASTDNPPTLERSFGWTQINLEEKQIKIQHSFDGNISEQHYFIGLPSRWYSSSSMQDVEACELCLPANPKDEQPLLETDSTAVTPALLLEKPEVIPTRRSAHKLADLTLNKSHISNYGLREISGRYNLFTFDPEKFLISNYDAAKKWLSELRINENVWKDKESVVLLTDCNHTNMMFVELVNQELFLSSARILHIDRGLDYVENFSKIYGDDLAGADRLFFVDDIIRTGSSFNRIHFFVHNALEAKDKHSDKHIAKEINGCICLIDTMQPTNYKWIVKKIKNAEGDRQIHSFCHFHLNSGSGYERKTPLEYEITRYRRLSEISYVSSVAQEFGGRSLTSKGSKPGKGGEPPGEHTNKLHLLWANHYLMEFFARFDFSVNDIKSWEDFYKNHFEPTLEPTFSDSLGAERLAFEEATLKSLTQSPFIQYKPIRVYMFEWILGQARQVVIEFAKAANSVASDDDISLLKFHLRRCTAINSSYLFSKEGIADTKTYNAVCSRFSQGSESRPSRFDVFFVRQVKELLFREPSRALKLEIDLQRTLKSKVEIHPAWKRTLRMIYIENGYAIASFYDFICRYFGKNCRDLVQQCIDEMSNHGSADTRDFPSQSIALFSKELAAQSITNNPRFKFIEQFLQGPPLENSYFLKYLWLRSYIAFDNPTDIERLESKIDVIVSGLKELVAPAKQSKLGALFLVHTYNTTTIVFDQDRNNKQVFGRRFWRAGSELDFTEFLKPEQRGQDNLQLTIFELKYSEGQWSERFGDAKSFEAITSMLPPKVDRMMLVTIWSLSKKSNDMTARGLIGLYYNSEEVEVCEFDSLRTIRYLSLLRGPIDRFIKKNIENNQFSELQVALKSKWYSSLHSHGQNMMPRFVANLSDEDTTIYDEIRFNLQWLRQIEYFRSFGDSGEIASDRFKSTPQLLSDLHKRYDDMAKHIIRSPAIELSLLIPDQYSISSIQTDDLYQQSVNVQLQLLDIIIFELLVNAKKNRLIFEQSCDGEGGLIAAENWLELNFGIDQRNTLIVTIKHSSLGIGTITLERLNLRQPVKSGSNEIAGTALIWRILDSVMHRPEGRQHSLRYKSDGCVEMTLAIALA